jgi:hypothetical protein
MVAPSVASSYRRSNRAASRAYRSGCVCVLADHDLVKHGQGAGLIPSHDLHVPVSTELQGEDPHDEQRQANDEQVGKDMRRGLRIRRVFGRFRLRHEDRTPNAQDDDAREQPGQPELPRLLMRGPLHVEGG